MPQNPQNKISQTELKHYNRSSVINEYFRWLKIKTYTGKKLKVETSVKEINQQLLEFIKIDVINIEQHNSSDHDIITLLMTKTRNSSFNKNPI